MSAYTVIIYHSWNTGNWDDSLKYEEDIVISDISLNHWSTSNDNGSLQMHGDASSD